MKQDCSSFDRILTHGITLIVLCIGGFGVWLYTQKVSFFDSTFGEILLNRKGTLAEWGQWGDYLSGQLTPVLTLLGLIALLLTIILQSRELSLTRYELRRTRVAQEETAKASVLANELDKARFITESSTVLGKLAEEIDKVNQEIGTQAGLHPTIADTMKSGLGSVGDDLDIFGGLMPNEKRRALENRRKSIVNSIKIINEKVEELLEDPSDHPKP